MNSRVMTLKENFEEQQPESDRKLFDLLFLFGHINTLLNNPARANEVILDAFKYPNAFYEIELSKLNVFINK